MFNSYQYYPDIVNQIDDLSVFAEESHSFEQILEDSKKLIKWLEDCGYALRKKEIINTCDCVIYDSIVGTDIHLRMRWSKLRNQPHGLMCCLSLSKYRGLVVLMKLSHASGVKYDFD